MFEKGIRGGITQAVKRNAKEYNKYMNDLYNPDEVSVFLQYVDINNEYGWSVMNNYQRIDFYGSREKTLHRKK